MFTYSLVNKLISHNHQLSFSFIMRQPVVTTLTYFNLFCASTADRWYIFLALIAFDKNTIDSNVPLCTDTFLALKSGVVFSILLRKVGDNVKPNTTQYNVTILKK